MIESRLTIQVSVWYEIACISCYSHVHSEETIHSAESHIKAKLFFIGKKILEKRLSELICTRLYISLEQLQKYSAPTVL